MILFGNFSFCKFGERYRRAALGDMNRVFYFDSPSLRLCSINHVSDHHISWDGGFISRSECSLTLARLVLLRPQSLCLHDFSNAIALLVSDLNCDSLNPQCLNNVLRTFYTSGRHCPYFTLAHFDLDGLLPFLRF